MLQMFRRLAILGVAAVAVMLGSSPAKAGFQVRITDEGTATTAVFNPVLPTDTTILASGLVGNFTVALEFAMTNSPGTANFAILTQNGTVLNTSTGADTLKVEVTSTGFTAPTTPPAINVSGSATGTVALGALTDVHFNSFLGVGMYDLATAGPQLGPLSATAPGALGPVAGASGTTTVTSLAAPFSITNILEATFAGGTFANNLGGNTTLTNVPEPATLAMALGAIPVLGVGRMIRRRKAQA